MTSRQSTARLILYVAGAMLASASAGLATVDLSDPKGVIGYALSIATTGVITALSYIDKSPSEVAQPEKADEASPNES